MKIYSGKLFRVVVYLVFSFPKRITWILFPALARDFYHELRRRHTSLVLLVHEGLGDLAVMAEAIKKLSGEHAVVYVVCRKDFFKAVALIFGFSDNVKNIPAREGKPKRYNISWRRIRALKRYGYLIRVGVFDNDPVFRYPNSFYLKLGCDFSLAAKKVYLDFSKFLNPQLEDFLRQIGKKFLFISTGYSGGALKLPSTVKIDPDLPVIIYSDKSEIKCPQGFFDLSLFNKGDFTRSLLNSLQVCCSAENVIISDAGLFNILAKLENKSNLSVIWRQHVHTLNKEIYGRYAGTKF